MKVTFIGIGQMGKNIALNILQQGHSLTVWNRKDSCWPNVQELIKQGAKYAENIAESVKDADIIGLSLASDDAVTSVLDEVYSTLKQGTIVVDFSTISPKCTKKISDKLACISVEFLDAPVSGGIQGAQDGNLTIMVGGDRDSYDKILPIFRAVGKNIHYLGSSGSGQVAKLINQILTGVNQAIVCEAMVIGEKSQIDLQELYNVLVTSWGNSRMLERSVPQYIIPRQYESAAYLDLMVKDLSIALKMAHDIGCNLPITQLTKRYYEVASSEGHGKLDHSYIFEIMRKENIFN